MSLLLQNKSNPLHRQRTKSILLVVVGASLAITIIPVKFRRAYVIVCTACVLAALCLPGTETSLERFADASPVTYESILELQHNTSMAKNSQQCTLVSTPATYWKPGSSGQNEVNVSSNQHWRSMWQIKRAFGFVSTGNESDAVSDGDILRLRDVWTDRNLHSHPIKADDPTGKFNEVTGYGNSNSDGDDTNSNWKIVIDGGGTLTSSSNVRFQHVTTGNWLHSFNSQVLLYSNQNVTSQIVATIAAPTVDSVWSIYRSESSANRAVRFYTDLNNAESAMDTYQAVGKLKNEVSLTTMRDNVSAKFLVGVIVPPGIMVDFYRGPNKDTFITRLTSGKYDNLNLGTIGTTVVRPFCTISLWENCNYTGQSACLQYGYSKIPFYPQSWQVSDGVVVKLFNADGEQTIQPSSNSATMTFVGGGCSRGSSIGKVVPSTSSDKCQQACLADPTCVATSMTGDSTCNLWVANSGSNSTSATDCYRKTPSFTNQVACNSTTNPSFSKITEVVAYPFGANVALFRDPTDQQSVKVFDTPAVATALPAVATQYLQCYLNSCVPESYTGGRIWKDLSGNNRHFAWKSPPRFTASDGSFRGIDVDGAVATGPPSDSFGLKDGSKGFTIALVCSAYKQVAQTSYTVSFADVNGDPRGLSANVPSSDGSIYFDNTATTGNRATVASTSYDPYQMAVVVLRRTNDKKLSIWVNGTKSTETSPTAVAALSLGKANVTLFNGHAGSARAFMVYNTGLADSDIATLTTYLNTTSRDYRSAITRGTSANLLQVLPDLKIADGLKCLLDARNPKSASPGSNVWRDLTNNHNDFSWTGTPVLKAGRFVGVNMNGGGLTGPPSDSFGISNAYTVFVVAKTNNLSASQSFGLKSSTQSTALSLTNASKNGTMMLNQAGTTATAPAPWQQYAVYTYRWSNTKSSGSKISLFVDGWRQNDATAGVNPVFNGTAAQIGGSPGDNVDWQADVGGFAVYDRALADSEIKVMADWMNAPMYGSSTPPSKSSTVPGTTKPSSGVCVNQTVGNKYYSKSQCISAKANTDGSFDAVDSAAGGWCFTDPADNTAKAFCGKRAEYPIDNAIDKTSPVMSYTSARQFCEAKGGRLCNADEICNSGPGGKPRVGFETLSKVDCATAGGTYDDTNKMCKAPDGSPYYVPNQTNYLPINDYNNAWMTIGTDDPTKMCRTIDNVTGTKPAWGQSTAAAPGRQNIMCCATGASGLSECDMIKDRLQTVLEQLGNNPDPATQVGLINTQNQLQTQYNQNCSFVPYQTAYTNYQTAEKQRTTLAAKVDGAHNDFVAQKTAVLGLNGVVDPSGKQYLDTASAANEKATPFTDGTFHAVGQIPDVKVKMSAVQTNIDAQKARLLACPANPTCPVPKEGVAAPAKSSNNGSCNTQDLVTSLLKQPVVAQNPAVGGRLRLALQPRNILSNTDIRTHKDYYKYVESKNVKNCNSLPSDTGKKPADFDISTYPGFKDSYVPLQSLDVASVPPDRLSDYNMLIGSSNSSRPA